MSNTPRITKKQMRHAAELREVMAGQVVDSLDESAKGRTTCAGCHGALVQTNKQTGIKVLCPVCNGTGFMPPPFPMPTVPFETWPTTIYPQYPGAGGNGAAFRPMRPEIID